MSAFETPNNAFLPERSRPRRDAANLAPLVIGGVITAMILMLNSPLAQWLRGFFSRRPRARDAPPGFGALDTHHSLAVLRDSILGRGKTYVAAAFGPPRTAAAASTQSTSIASSRPTTFWNADTWYYPVDATAQTAMAVRFKDGIARAVDFFDAPGVR